MKHRNGPQNPWWFYNRHGYRGSGTPAPLSSLDVQREIVERFEDGVAVVLAGDRRHLLSLRYRGRASGNSGAVAARLGSGVRARRPDNAGAQLDVIGRHRHRAASLSPAGSRPSSAQDHAPGNLPKSRRYGGQRRAPDRFGTASVVPVAFAISRQLAAPRGGCRRTRRRS